MWAKHECMDIRRRHYLGKSMTRFPQNTDPSAEHEDFTEFEVHCKLLGCNPGEIRVMANPKIWIGHFWEEDLKPIGNNFKFGGLVDGVTRYQDPKASTGSLFCFAVDIINLYQQVNLTTVFSVR